MSYARFRRRCWDAVSLAKLYWWMAVDEWPWQRVTLLHKPADKTGVTGRTVAGRGTDSTYAYTTWQRCPHCAAFPAAPPGQVLFNGPPRVPKCMSQSGTTGFCLEIMSTLPPPPKTKFNWKVFQMDHATKCDCPVCVACLLCLRLSAPFTSKIFLGWDCRDQCISFFLSLFQFPQQPGCAWGLAGDGRNFDRKWLVKRFQRRILKDGPRLCHGSMRGLVIPPTSLGESLPEARLTRSHPLTHTHTSLIYSFILTQTLFLSNGLCRVIFTHLSLSLSFSPSFVHNVLVSSIPEAAGYAERKCDPTHTKWMKGYL